MIIILIEINNSISGIIVYVKPLQEAPSRKIKAKTATDAGMTLSPHS
jgi:hypothetical protein